MTAKEIIDRLSLIPHPEGGHYRETWVSGCSGRPAGTSIYFLLQGDEINHWHKIDAAEIWHFYCGAPLILSMSESDHGPARHCKLGTDLANGEAPQIIIPSNYWQKARCNGSYTLVGCTVSPGFQFENFVLAGPGFDIF